MVSDAPSVLIVDDDADLRELIGMILEDDGLEVVGVAGDGVEGVRVFEGLEHAPSAVVVDQRMPGLDGVETAERILAASPNQVVVLFSAGLDAALVSRALGVGILQCIDKGEMRRLPLVIRTLVGS